MRRWFLAGGAVAAAFLVQASPAFACGGLVAPDGDVHLDKATTFVAWHAGVEHYVTSFAYTGSSPDVGWIVPLPAIPQSIAPAGRWTLQRLELQFNPPKFDELQLTAGAANAPRAAVVVEQVQVEALDVTVLKGSGGAVIAWCEHNGFQLNAETRAHLLRYAVGSPIFMAAKYDTAAAQQRGLHSGDGVPLLITMRTSQLWVPLEVLANDGFQVNADLFLLSDAPLRTVAEPPILPAALPGSTVDGAPGFTVVAVQPMGQQLFSDLSSDRNMSWVPRTGWLTYLRLNAPSDDVTYDLGVGGDRMIRLADFGTAPQRAAAGSGYAPAGAPIALATAVGVSAAGTALLLAVAGIGLARRRRAREPRAA
jgi:Uncharacterized protein conserved in bacteria (DUF2330)